MSKSGENAFDFVSFVMAFEGGELESEEELIDGFQHMIDNGLVWGLQGMYGRTAKSLIDAGHCHAVESRA